ncbi:Macrolide export protein MacA [Alphaproteobacteria bacterium SO-S41]|nr:Macrolide export protein MacA [Alphaproteobacteria bacterium SO-S41]
MNHMTTAPVGIEKTLGVGKKKRSLRTKSLIWLGGIGAVVVVLFLLFSGGGAPVGFKAEAVKRGPLSVKVTATGTLQPIDQVDVGAEVSGRVVEVKVDFNNTVKTGDILAQIDTTQLEARRIQTEAQLAAAKAGVRQAEAALSDAARRLERLRDLAKGRNVSQQDLDTAQATYDQAVAGLEVAKAQVAIQDANLKVAVGDIDKAVIKSPIDGIVLYRNVEPGQTVAASFQTPILFTLASDIKNLELLADIDEADVGQVDEEQGASFTVDAFPNRTFEARIRSLRNAPKKADAATGATSQGVVVYQAELSVNNEAGLLKPGMTATAEITVKTVESAILVPNAALRFVPPDISMSEAIAEEKQGGEGQDKPRDPTAGRVFIEEGGKPVEHKVKIGATDGAFTEILEGDLKEGDNVLTDLARAGSGA